MKAAYLMWIFLCITDMIDHIVIEYAKTFEGTKHKNYWVFYHDALSLITADATIAWMKEKGYLKRYVLLVNVLNKEN